jgi:hypothetical protein
MSSDILELVTLYLWDHGPSTMTDIALHTCIPRASLRTHLALNEGERYSCALSDVDGIPTRHWALLPAAPTQELE